MKRFGTHCPKPPGRADALEGLDWDFLFKAQEVAGFYEPSQFARCVTVATNQGPVTFTVPAGEHLKRRDQATPSLDKGIGLLTPSELAAGVEELIQRGFSPSFIATFVEAKARRLLREAQRLIRD